jgi:hypothetical protein
MIIHDEESQKTELFLKKIDFSGNLLKNTDNFMRRNRNSIEKHKLLRKTKITIDQPASFNFKGQIIPLNLSRSPNEEILIKLAIKTNKKPEKLKSFLPKLTFKANNKKSEENVLEGILSIN